MGRKALGQQPEREDGPQGIEPDLVQQGWTGRAPHAEQAGADPLDHRQGDAAQDHQQEKVHQEEQQRPLDGGIRLRHEEIEEDRIVEEPDALRQEQHHLHMAQDDDHEPPECDARVHIAQQPVPLPQLHVQEAVTKDVLDVLERRPRRDEGQEETPPVLPRQLEQDPDDAVDAIPQHENHARQERKHERMEAGGEAFNHRSCTMSISNDGY